MDKKFSKIKYVMIAVGPIILVFFPSASRTFMSLSFLCRKCKSHNLNLVRMWSSSPFEKLKRYICSLVSWLVFPLSALHQSSKFFVASGANLDKTSKNQFFQPSNLRSLCASILLEIRPYWVLTAKLWPFFTQRKTLVFSPLPVFRHSTTFDGHTWFVLGHEIGNSGCFSKIILPVISLV